MNNMDAPSRSPEELLQATANRDRQAFSELYDIFADLTYGITLRVVQDQAIAQESTQEVWLEIWDKACNYDPRRGTARSWIARVAHNRAVDTVRSNESSRQRLEIAGRREAVGSEPPASERLEMQEDSNAVTRCLDTLTDIQREAVHLAYYSGLTQKEIAAKTGAGLSAIKTRLRDGMLALRRCMST